LFEAGSDPKSTDNFGCNAFHYQDFDVENKLNALAVAECLHLHGVDINSLNNFDDIPVGIHMCQIVNFPEIVEKYFQLGSNPNSINAHGNNLFS
jgi:hypothetical protein